MFRTPSLALAALLSASLSAQGLTLTVNDTDSHGVVGDSSLSLEEAIRLANGSLAVGSLSSAEQLLITGVGPDVGRIEVAVGVTTITLQQELSAITAGTPGSGRLVISGVPIGGTGQTTLLGTSQGVAQPTILRIRSRHVNVESFVFDGGAVGVDGQLPVSNATMPERAFVISCDFQNQTNAGVRLTATGDDETFVTIQHAEFTDVPVGVSIFDQAVGGRVQSECEFVSMERVDLGLDVDQRGSGPLSRHFFFRSEFVGGTLARLRRSATSPKTQAFRFIYTDAECSGDVTDLQGSAAGLTIVHHHHGDFTASNGNRAFWVYPRTAEFDVHGSEMVFDGDVEIRANRFSQRIWHQNIDYLNGTVTYDVDGALPNLVWNRYDQCTVHVPSSARSPVVARACELTSTDVQADSAFAPVRFEDSWRNGGSLSGFVTEQTPAGARFLGSTSVGPADPVLGSQLTLETDLPGGVAMLWYVFPSLSRPTTTAEPVRFYGDTSTSILVPGLYTGRSTRIVNVPNDPSLLEVELYFQGVSVPLFGQPQIPVFHLPRGHRVQLR